LQIRIKKAPLDEKGKVLTIGQNLDIEKAIELGMIDTPDLYSGGGYNTLYCAVSANESIIMEAKLLRHAPNIKDVIESIMVQKNDGQAGRSTEVELREYCEEYLMSKPCLSLSTLSKFPYLDIKFFSEYIPELGFTSDITFLFDFPAKSLYYVVVSLAPPGRLYLPDKSKQGVEETKAGTDVQVAYNINFDSPIKSMQFNDSRKKFYVTQPDSSMILIYEIYEVKISKTGIERVTPFGFTFLPIFQYVELSNGSDGNELYLNTSFQQLLVFKGVPDENFISR
jgi:hypothetical protein